MNIYNPDDYPLVWVRAVENSSGSIESFRVSATNYGIPGTTVTMPEFHIQYPTSAPSNITYNHGILDFDGSGDAFLVFLESEEGYSGYITGSSKSISFPSDVNAIIETGTGWDAYIYSVNMSTSFDIDQVYDLIESGGSLPGFEFAYIFDSTNSNVNDLIP